MTERPAPPAAPLEPDALARAEREAKAVASPDGSRVAIAGREVVSSLVLLEGVAGLGPSK